MNLPEPQKVRRVRQKPRLAEVVRLERLTPIWSGWYSPGKSWRDLRRAARRST